MPFLDLSQFCENGTVIFHLAKSADYNETSRTIRVTARGRLTDSDQQAVLYIVVVLLFYSCGIIVGIVMYLKRERDELEEERAYEDYLNFKADPGRMNRHFCKQQYTTRLREMEEMQRLRQEKERQQGNKDKLQKEKRLAKKRHSHGNFHFFTSSRNTSPSSPTSSRPKPKIIVDNFDDLVERGEIIRNGGGSIEALSCTIDIEIVQQDRGWASSMPALNRSESQKSNLIVTEL